MTEIELKQLLPVGWYKFIPEILEINRIFNISVLQGIDIRNSVLYLIFDKNLSMSPLLTYISQGMMIASSKTCIQCGKFAKRRKLMENSPSLCAFHHIEALNKE